MSTGATRNRDYTSEQSTFPLYHLPRPPVVEVELRGGDIAITSALTPLRKYKNAYLLYQALLNANGAEYVDTVEELRRHPQVEYVDVCTLPNSRLPVVELCARYGKHVLLQKPMAIDLPTASRMMTLARDAAIQLGVVSQHRFDDSTRFLKKAIDDGRLGRLVVQNYFGSAFSRSGCGVWSCPMTVTFASALLSVST